MIDRARHGAARSAGPRKRFAERVAAAHPRGAPDTLLGSQLPSVELAWTTELHGPASSWIKSTLDLRVEGHRSKPLVLYLYPPQPHISKAAALPAAFALAEADGLLTAGTLIGLSNEPPGQQRKLAAAQRINHLLLSDPTRSVARMLPGTPTLECRGSIHYAPFTLIVSQGRIRATFRPSQDRPLSHHTAAVAQYLSRVRNPTGRRRG
ncbi:MAG: thioredoxin domain-containing protein [Solirubrobacteraceae bacterium]